MASGLLSGGPVFAQRPPDPAVKGLAEIVVTDEWDLQALRRAAKRVPGVTRVVNKLDLVLGGE